MKLLLDTCEFLWFISGDSRLSANSQTAIRDPDNEVYLSVISVWEIIIKYALGKLLLPEAPFNYVPSQRRLHDIESLPLHEDAVKRLADLPMLHRDPFDRILVCQAQDLGMRLVSSDPKIRQYPVDVL